MGAMRRTFGYLRPYGFWVAVKLAVAVINAANDIFLVYLINLLVNASLAGDWDELTRFAYLIAIFVVVGIAVNFLETYSAGRFSASAARDMKDDFSRRLGRLPVSCLELRHSGDLVSRIANGVGTIERFLRDELMAVVFHIIRMAVSLAVLLYMNWQLTLASMLLIPLMAALTQAIARPMNKAGARLQESLGTTQAAVQDMIGGIAVIKSYNLAGVLSKKFRQANDRLLADSLAIEKRRSLMDSVGVLVRTTPFLLFFLYGGYLVVNGHLTAGGFVAFAQLVNYLVQGMGILPGLLANCRVAAGVAAHLFELMDEPTERSGGVSPSGFSSDVPALVFEDVSFSYDGEKRCWTVSASSFPKGRPWRWSARAVPANPRCSS
mgnify:CR=1 FL=1